MPDLHIHDLRHTVGMRMRLREAGVREETIADILWHTRPGMTAHYSVAQVTGGALAHPGMSIKGGILAGLPAIVSAASPSSVGSPAEGGSIALIDAAQVLVADDNGAAFEVARHASLQMSDGPVPGPTSLVSMWQTDSAALKTTRYANWQACRPHVAIVLDLVAY